MALKLQFHCTCSKNAFGVLLLFLSISVTFCAPPETQLCDSHDAKKITDSIAASIDRSVQLCDDFYEHACGYWSEIHPAPCGANIWNNPHMVSNNVLHQLKDLFDTLKYEEADTLEGKAKMAYDVCNNLDQIERNGIKFLLAITNDMGGWPMITPHSERIEATYSWQTAHVTYGGFIGEGGLININVEDDPFKNNKPTLYLDQPNGLFKGLSIMNTREDEKKYKEFVKTVAQAFSMERNKAHLDKKTLGKDIRDLLRFRKRLQEIMTWGPKKRNVKQTNNLKTIKELQEWNAKLSKKFECITIQWKPFIKTTTEYSRNIEITDKENIILHEMDYIKNLLILLAETDEEVIVNHIHLFCVEKYLKYTGRRIGSLASTVRGDNDKPSNVDRWKTCILTHPMKHVVSLMYVKKYFSDTKREELKQMAFGLQNTLIEEIEQSPWLSKGVKENAVKKLKGIKFIFGCPDWYRNEKLMNDYYEGQEVSDDHLYNILNYERAAYRREIEKLSPLNPRYTMDAYPMEVDIGYIIPRNELEIPAAALQPPFLNGDVPDVISYATIGYILAHELSHALDRQGRMHDMHGFKKDWWDKQTLAGYKKRMKCIIDKYDNFRIKELQDIRPHLRTKGIFTADEDFSDILGLNIAYKCYKKKRLVNTEYMSLNIPALKGLNEDKIFFYAYAQMHCEYIESDVLIDLIENDEHSISRFRVNIPLSNMPEFNAAFGCPADSFMNPKHKCHIWDK